MATVYAVSWGAEGGAFVTNTARQEYINYMVKCGAGRNYQKVEEKFNELPDNVYMVGPFSEAIEDVKIELYVSREEAIKSKRYFESEHNDVVHIEQYVLTGNIYKYKTDLSL